MKQKKQPVCPQIDSERLLRDLESPDAEIRGRAVRALCPCHAGRQLFEQHLDVVERLRKDPSPVVRAHALHVFEDADQMENGGYPTNPREVTNEMLRRKRASRFRLEEEELQARQQEKQRRRDGHQPRGRA